MSVFASCMTTLASKALLLSVFFLSFMSLAFFIAHIMVGAVLLTLSHTLTWSFLQLNLLFESATCSTILLLLSRYDLADRGNLLTWCWCSLIDTLSEKGNYCIKILLMLVWVYPYCGDCYGKLVTSNAIQPLLNF